MNVVFDIGNVLIHWDPRALYRKIFKTEDEVAWFLGNVCTADWNLEQDRGRSFEEAIAEAIARARRGEGPSLVECKTYRTRGHSRSDRNRYRTKEEIEEWKARDPIPHFESELMAHGIATEAELAAIRESPVHESYLTADREALLDALRWQASVTKAMSERNDDLIRRNAELAAAMGVKAEPPPAGGEGDVWAELIRWVETADNSDDMALYKPLLPLMKLRREQLERGVELHPTILPSLEPWSAGLVIVGQ